MMSELDIVFEKEKSTNRCKRYLVKRGKDIMFIYIKMLPPKELDDYGTEYKFEPVLSTGLVPKIRTVNGKVYIYFVTNDFEPSVNLDTMNQFIENTKFAKEAAEYIVNNLL